jgi:hypothetical protein
MRIGGEGKESVLFEKKNQKTFESWAEALRKDRSQICKSFLLLFFKKEVLACFLSGGLRAPRAPLGRGRRRSIGQRAQQGKTRDE